jgi:hypothetical protein
MSIFDRINEVNHFLSIDKTKKSLSAYSNLDSFVVPGAGTLMYKQHELITI